MAVYVAGYGVGRLWVESLRIDPANEVAGLRVNQWMAILPSSAVSPTPCGRSTAMASPLPPPPPTTNAPADA